MGYALKQQEFEIAQLVHQWSPTKREKQLQQQILNRSIEMELLQELQSKLDISSISISFSRIISSIIPHSGISISGSHPAMEATAGEYGNYQEGVDLILNGENLGTATLMGWQPFNQYAAICFRYLARHMVYPIKNALLVNNLKKETLTDPLTRTLNRTALHHDLEQEIRLSLRERIPFTLTMIDIDHFKRVNDRHGHTTGDRVLKILSREIRQQIRQSDRLYRYGGEEFTLLLHNTTIGHSSRKIQAILNTIERYPFTTAEIDRDPSIKDNGSTSLQNCSEGRARVPERKAGLFQITLSAGLTEWRAGDRAESLIKRADQALYCSKSNGRNQLREL